MAIGDATTNDLATGATNVPTTGWHHIAGTKNGTGANALKAFLDGVQDASVTSNRTIQSTGQDFRIGNRAPNDTPFDGLIAEVAIWNIALNASEIAALARGVSPLLIRRQNLQGYWPIWGVGSPERDYSGKGGHGTVTGTLTAARHAPVAPFVPPSITGLAAIPNPLTEDAATVYFDLEATSVDSYETIDDATVLVDLQASGVEELVVPTHSVDADTIYLDIRVRGIEEGIFWETFENLDAWEIDDNSGFGTHAYITKRHATDGPTSLRYTVDQVYGSPAFYRWLDLDNGDDPNIKYWLSFAFMIEDWGRVWRDGAGQPFYLPIDLASEDVDYAAVGAVPLIRPITETTGEIGFFDGNTTTWTAINAKQWYQVQVGWQNDGTDITYEVWFEGVQEIVSDPVWLGSNQPQWIPKGLIIWTDLSNVSGVVYLDDVIYSPDVQPRQPSIIESAPQTTTDQWVMIREKPSGPFASVYMELDPTYSDLVTEAWVYGEIYISQAFLDALQL